MHKKLSIILLALVGTSGIGLISPVMASFALDFPDVDTSAITMLVTFPAFTILPALFIASALVTRIERMWINAAAFFCVVLGGVLPAFLSNFLLIMICRGVLGFGMGLLMPIQSTYIAECPEKERPALFGWSQGVNNIINSCLIMLVGIISVSTWKNAFLLYGIFVVVFLIVLTGLPRTGPLGGGTNEEVGQADEQVAPKNKLGLRFAILCVSNFFAQCLAAAMMSSFSFYVATNNLGGTKLTSAISSAGVFSLAIASIIIPQMMSIFRTWSGTIFLAITAAAFLLTAQLNPILIAVGYCISYAFAGVYCTNVSITITQILPLERVAFASSITTASIFIGMFLATPLMTLIANVMGVPTTSPMVFVGFAVVLVVMAIINLPLLQKKNVNT